MIQHQNNINKSIKTKSPSCYQVYCPTENIWRCFKTVNAFGQSAKVMNNHIILLNRLSFSPSQVDIRLFYPDKNICKKLAIGFCTKMLREIFVYKSSIFCYFSNCWKKCKLNGTILEVCDSKVIQTVQNNKKLILYHHKVLSIGNKKQFSTTNPTKIDCFNLEKFQQEPCQVSAHFEKPLEAVLFMKPLADDREK